MPKDVKILLVDDQVDFVVTFSFWMKAKGFQVTTASDGPAALDVLKKDAVDVVFVDLKMPGMNGIELITKIRESNKTIPVIILTAYTEDKTLQGNEHLNISGFFSKLRGFEGLDRAVNALLHRVERTESN